MSCYTECMKKNFRTITLLTALFLCAITTACSGSIKNQSKNLSDAWWKQEAIYHIWIKGFCDSDGDGCGDINGIRSKLDYLHNDVGCDVLWISPFFECAGKGTAVDYNMHGYDTTDYYAVNSLFGTEEDVLALVAECHERGMKIIFDFVPNHTSSAHPWFKDSIAGKNGKRDWYVWSEDGKGSNPMGASPAWFYNEEAGAWYYAPFWEHMPDLNYKNAAVQKEMRSVVFYWLDRGFDGIRVDAARYLIEDGSRSADSDSTHQWFTDLHARIQKRYKAPKVMLGEIWLERRRDSLEAYFGSAEKPEFDLVTDFDTGRAQLGSVLIGASSLPDASYENPHDIKGAAYAAFLCNHDEYQSRLGSVFGNDYKRITLSLVLAALRPPVPIIYYGQEIGLADMNLSGDIRHRGPFDWQTAQKLLEQSDSSIHVLQKALALRKQYATTITDATVEDLSPNRGQCAAYVLHPQDSSQKDMLCVFNFSANDFSEYIFTKKQKPLSVWTKDEMIFATPEAEGASLVLEDERLVVTNIPARSAVVFLLDQ